MKDRPAGKGILPPQIFTYGYKMLFPSRHKIISSLGEDIDIILFA